MSPHPSYRLYRTASKNAPSSNARFTPHGLDSFEFTPTKNPATKAGFTRIGLDDLTDRDQFLPVVSSPSSSATRRLSPTVVVIWSGDSAPAASAMAAACWISSSTVSDS